MAKPVSTGTSSQLAGKGVYTIRIDIYPIEGKL
jgi:hypothetical protein